MESNNTVDVSREIYLEMSPYKLARPLSLIIEASHESIIYSPETGTVPQSDRRLGLWGMRNVRLRMLQQGKEDDPLE